MTDLRNPKMAIYTTAKVRNSKEKYDYVVLNDHWINDDGTATFKTWCSKKGFRVIHESGLTDFVI